MSVELTRDQILDLAPDPGSRKNGEGLANARHWVSLGYDRNAVWGECQGSGSKPYQVQIDLSEPAFKCSCPSRKFPCKHGIGLFLLYAESRDKLTEGTPPDWVADWLGQRSEKAQKKEEKKAAEAERSPEEQAKADALAAKRAAARDKKATQGLKDLDLWMRDIIRQGFSTADVRSYRVWDGIAARMVDAQVPGAARLLRDMATIPTTRTRWQEKLLERMGNLYLLTEGYRRLESLPEPHQADIRQALGFTQKQEELRTNPDTLKVEDLWLNLGQYTQDEDGLRTRRAWMAGVNSGKFALVLHFARIPAPLDLLPPTGAGFYGTMTFYPGVAPLRAILPEQWEIVRLPPAPGGFAAIEAFLSAFADSVAANPWQEAFPAWLQEVTLVQDEAAWFLCDRSGAALPLRQNWEGAWRLLAVSGGHTLPSLFAEWDGESLLPLSVITPDRRLATLASS